MEDSDEFNWAVRVVIKRQLRDLLQQLHERGDEIAVLAINTDNGSYSNFGSSFGECFVSEQKSLMPNFLKYCRELKQKPGLEQSVLRTVPVPTTMTIHTPVVRQPGTQHTQPSTLSTFRAGENYALASMEKSSDSVGSSKTVLRIKIPKTIAAGTRDLPGLVGDLVSSQLSGKKKMEIQTEAKSKEIERKRAIVNSPDESVRKRTRKSAMLDTKSSEDKTKTSTPKQPESTPTKDTTDPTDVPFTRARRSTRKMTVRYIEGLESMKKKKSRGKTDESMESNEDAVPDSAEADDSMDVATVKTPSKRLTDTNQGVTKQVAATQDKDVVGETTATEVTGDGLKDIMRQVDLATVGHDLGNKEIRGQLVGKYRGENHPINYRITMTQPHNLLDISMDIPSILDQTEESSQKRSTSNDIDIPPDELQHLTSTMQLFMSLDHTTVNESRDITPEPTRDMNATTSDLNLSFVRDRDRRWPNVNVCVDESTDEDTIAGDDSEDNETWDHETSTKNSARFEARRHTLITKGSLKGGKLEHSLITNGAVCKTRRHAGGKNYTVYESTNEQNLGHRGRAKKGTVLDDDTAVDRRKKQTRVTVIGNVGSLNSAPVKTFSVNDGTKEQSPVTGRGAKSRKEIIFFKVPEKDGTMKTVVKNASGGTRTLKPRKKNSSEVDDIMNVDGAMDDEAMDDEAMESLSNMTDSEKPADKKIVIDVVKQLAYLRKKAKMKTGEIPSDFKAVSKGIGSEKDEGMDEQNQVVYSGDDDDDYGNYVDSDASEDGFNGTRTSTQGLENVRTADCQTNAQSTGNVGTDVKMGKYRKVKSKVFVYKHGKGLVSLLSKNKYAFKCKFCSKITLDLTHQRLCEKNPNKETRGSGIQVTKESPKTLIRDPTKEMTIFPKKDVRVTSESAKVIKKPPEEVWVTLDSVNKTKKTPVNEVQVTLGSGNETIVVGNCENDKTATGKDIVTASESDLGIANDASLSPQETAEDNTPEFDSNTELDQFKCYMCKDGFPTYNLLRRHVTSNECIHRSQEFTCSHAKQQCVDNETETETENKQSKNPTFDKALADTLLNKYKGRKKMPEPPLNISYVCEICGMKLKNSSIYYSHIRIIHENYRPHHCDVCGRDFCSRNQIENHQTAVHTRKCNNCETYIAEVDRFAKGVTIFTPREVLCGNCNSIVLFYSGCKRSVIDGNERATTATYAPSKVDSADTNTNDDTMLASTAAVPSVDAEQNVFVSKRPFRKRTRKRKAKEAHACGICDKLFGTKSAFDRHQYTHTEQPTQMCDVCGKQIRSQGSLVKHRRAHFVKPRNYYCHVCSKQVVTRCAYKIHMRNKHKIDYKTIPRDQQQVPIEKLDTNNEPGANKDAEALGDNFSGEFNNLAKEEDGISLSEIVTTTAASVADFEHAGSIMTDSDVITETIDATNILAETCIGIDTAHIDGIQFAIPN